MSSLVKASTFSKDPSAFGFEPGLCVMGPEKGCFLRLSDGSRVLDWINGLGSNLIGYDFSPEEFDWGSFSLPHHLEYEVADMLADLLHKWIPGWHTTNLGVRWGKTGTDATTMAVRLARAVTSTKDTVLSCGYHGWSAWSVAATSPAHGIPACLNPLIKKFEFGDYSIFDYEFPFAAVIIEQPAFDPPEGWYQSLRDFCNEHKALLIVDEVVTGLRYGLGGACGKYGIEPDLICMGKSLGNGAPISALVGPLEYMRWFARKDPVFCSSTNWGEAFGLSFAKAVLETWSTDKVDYIWNIGESLMRGLKNSGWDVFGHGARSVLRFKDIYERAWFIQGMRAGGILMNRPNFPCLAHTFEHVNETIKIAAELRSRFDADPEKAKKSMENHLPIVLFENR